MEKQTFVVEQTERKLTPLGLLDPIGNILDPGEKNIFSHLQIEDVFIAISLLVAEWRKEGKPVSHKLIEAIWRGTKLVNSDIAIIDEKGRLYILPWDLDPSQTHLPGTTHRLEGLDSATARLLRGELKDFGIKFDTLRQIACLQLRPTDRGTDTTSNLFVFYPKSIPEGREEYFFHPDKIDFAALVPTHELDTVPWLIKQWYLGPKWKRSLRRAWDWLTQWDNRFG